MKFSLKIVLGTCIIIAICFSLGGIFMIQKNFSVAYDNAVQAFSKQHIVNRYSLELNIRSAMESGREFSDSMVSEFADKMVSYGSEKSEAILQNGKGKVIFSSIRDIDRKTQNYINRKEGYYEIYEKREKHYFLIGSKIRVSENVITMVNRFDMSDTFAERDRQTQTFFLIDVCIIMIAFILVWFLSFYLTRNIKKLSQISSKISGGKYGIRTDIKSKDEIGELSKNFDIMARSVEEHIEKLEKDVEAREQFVSDFSHELKTPMTSMMGYSKMLLGDSLTEEQQYIAAEYIYRECKRLKRLSVTLLKMLEITEEKIEYKWLYTNLIVENIEKICFHHMMYSTLEINMEQGQIFTDADLLITLVRNLVENADKACKDRDGGKVCLNGTVRSSKYLISVRDNGCGMAENEIEKVTDAFYMIDKARDRTIGGTGIGLYICKKICEALEIEMTIKSILNKGTEIELLISKYRDVLEEDL